MNRFFIYKSDDVHSSSFDVGSSLYTWEGGREVGTTFKYFCNMLEDRNVVDFETDNQDLIMI